MNWDSIRVVSWDVDGTLYNIRRMKEQGGAILLASIFRGEFISGCREIRALFRFRDRMREIRQAGGDYSVKPDPHLRCLLLEYSSRWWAPATARTGLLKGVSEMIAALSERGIRQVCSLITIPTPSYGCWASMTPSKKCMPQKKLGTSSPPKPCFNMSLTTWGSNLMSWFISAIEKTPMELGREGRERQGSSLDRTSQTSDRW